jgi:hypothetical protein
MSFPRTRLVELNAGSKHPDHRYPEYRPPLRCRANVSHGQGVEAPQVAPLTMPRGRGTDSHVNCPSDTPSVLPAENRACLFRAATDLAELLSPLCHSAVQMHAINILVHGANLDLALTSLLTRAKSQ